MPRPCFRFSPRGGLRFVSKEDDQTMTFAEARELLEQLAQELDECWQEKMWNEE